MMMNDKDISNEIYKDRSFRKEIDSSISLIESSFSVDAYYSLKQKTYINNVAARNVSLYKITVMTGVAIHDILKDYTDEDKNKIIKQLTDDFLFTLKYGEEV